MSTSSSGDKQQFSKRKDNKDGQNRSGNNRYSHLFFLFWDKGQAQYQYYANPPTPRTHIILLLWILVLGYRDYGASLVVGLANQQTRHHRLLMRLYTFELSLCLLLPLYILGFFFQFGMYVCKSLFSVIFLISNLLLPPSLLLFHF